MSPEDRDQWFDLQFGARPPGEISEIQRIRDLRQNIEIEERRLREILDWESNRRAILYAWLAFGPTVPLNWDEL